MPTTLGRVTPGLIFAFDLSSVPNGTELNGYQGWRVYEEAGDGYGLYVITGGEIVSAGTSSYCFASWLNSTVQHPGHVVRADVMSPSWDVTVPGLSANGSFLHDGGGDTRGIFGNSWELRQRSGVDYGGGFPISTGPTPGAPLVGGQYYDFLLASVQNPGPPNHPRGGICYNNLPLAFSDTNDGLLTGVNNGSNTYPGLVYWRTAGLHWKNYKVYRDYRLTVQGLAGSQAFRVYDALGAVLFSSPSQVGGKAQVNVHLRTWPFEGYIEVFTDTTWATPAANGRFPTSGNDTHISGGDIYGQVNLGERPGILINWQDDREFPDEWGLHTEKDVTLDAVEYDILQIAGNPTIQVDTCTLTLADPTGKYVPARTESPLYPNVRLGREGRIVFTHGTPPLTVCRFYGKVAAYRVLLPTQDEAEQRVEIRLESPLRQIASSQVVLNFPFQGPLVNADGSGVISSILDLIADIIPPEVRQLTPTPDSIPESFLNTGMTVQTALEQCAIFSDCLYFVNPHYRTAGDQPNFYFVWIKYDAAGEVADHTWNYDVGDFDGFEPNYSADVL